MLRSILFAFFLVFTAHLVHAQDTIYRTDNQKVLAKIEEVGTTEIRYKRYGSPEGPLYIVKKSEVRKIVYADGTVEDYSVPEKAKTTLPPARRWGIGINFLDLVVGGVTINAEYAVNDRLSFKVPVSSGVNALFNRGPVDANLPDFYYYNRDKIFSTGLDAQLNVFQGEYVNYFIAFTSEYGQVDVLYYHYDPYYYWSEERRLWYIAGGLKNGVVLKPSPQLSATIDCALGMDMNDYFGYRPMVRIGMSLTYHFGREVPAAPVKKSN